MQNLRDHGSTSHAWSQTIATCRLAHRHQAHVYSPHNTAGQSTIPSSGSTVMSTKTWRVLFEGTAILVYLPFEADLSAKLKFNIYEPRAHKKKWAGTTLMSKTLPSQKQHARVPNIYGTTLPSVPQHWNKKTNEVSVTTLSKTLCTCPNCSTYCFNEWGKCKNKTVN